MPAKKSGKKKATKLKLTLSQQVAGLDRVLSLIQPDQNPSEVLKSVAGEIAKTTKFSAVLLEVSGITGSSGTDPNIPRKDPDIRDSVSQSGAHLFESNLSMQKEAHLAFWNDLGFESVACFPLTQFGGKPVGTLTLCHKDVIALDKSLLGWISRTAQMLGAYGGFSERLGQDGSDREAWAGEEIESKVLFLQEEIASLKQKSAENLAELQAKMDSYVKEQEGTTQRKLKEQKSTLNREFRKTLEKAVVALRQKRSALADYSDIVRKLRAEASGLRETQGKVVTEISSILMELLNAVENRKFYPELHRHVLNLLPAQDFYVAIYRGDLLTFPYFSSSRKRDASAVADEEKGFIDYVIRTGEPLLTSTDEIALFDSKDSVACNWLGVPIFETGTPRGILVVQGTQVKYGESEKALLQSIALLVSLLMEKSKASEKQSSSAVWDELTLLPNHRLYPLLVSQHFGHARRHKEMTASMLLELELMQSNNDPASIPDIVLKQASDRMLRRMREGDVVVRFGERRFLWSFGGLHKIQDAMLVAEKLLGNLSSPFIVEGDPYKLSGRIGISIFPNDGNEPDILMSKAEVALEKSRNTPANCFRFYDRLMNVEIASREEKPLAAGMKEEMKQAQVKEPASLMIQRRPATETTTGRKDASAVSTIKPVPKTRERSDETQPLSPFLQKVQSYSITCQGCHTEYNALPARWCRCLTDEPTLTCSKCNACFCKSSVDYKHRVWESAPDSLWERRRKLQAEYSTIPVNPSAGIVKPPLVLVVDDEHPVLMSAWKGIRSMGYSVILARNGEEGLGLVKEYTPGLVISDALMPKMDGRELCRILKGDPQTAGIKTIIMTSFTGAGKYRKGVMKEFHFDEHLQKPIDYDRLRSVLKRHLPLA